MVVRRTNARLVLETRMISLAPAPGVMARWRLRGLQPLLSISGDCLAQAVCTMRAMKAMSRGPRKMPEVLEAHLIRLPQDMCARRACISHSAEHEKRS